jgi:hypothetical protein
MRYKTQVANKLDSIDNFIKTIIRGLEEKRLSPQDIVEKLKSALTSTEQAIEMVDKEKDELPH